MQTMAEYLHVEKFFLDQCHKILKVMKENRSPAPKFENDDDRTHLLIRLPVHTRTTRLASGEVTGELQRKRVVRPDGVTRGAKWRLYKAGSEEEI